MTLTEQDRIDIIDLINRHGHLVDAGELDLVITAIDEHSVRVASKGIGIRGRRHGRQRRLRRRRHANSRRLADQQARGERGPRW